MTAQLNSQPNAQPNFQPNFQPNAQPNAQPNFQPNAQPNAQRFTASNSLRFLLLSTLFLPQFIDVAPAQASTNVTIECDMLVAGGGLAGAATAYEGLLAGRTVCLTEITDWVGGQLSSQGTSALNERTTQRERRVFPRGYLEFSDRIHQFYKRENPGDCWVSKFCFLPRDGHTVLFDMLKDAAKKGDGKLHWYPSTVIKKVEQEQANITSAIAIQHQPAPGAPPLNTEPLSQVIEDAYTYEDSKRLTKTIIRFVPKPKEDAKADAKTAWYVVDATETGELVALTDVPYRLGIDPRSHYNPSSAEPEANPYCTQGFTYTFAMEATADNQPQPEPDFYPQYAPYYSYEQARFADFNVLFTYRRIWRPMDQPTVRGSFSGLNYITPQPGDISMQNWTWGNDYRPGTSVDNLILSRDQLLAEGQLEPDGWRGGLRQDTLRKGEESALGFYHWLVAGTTDSQLGDGVKKPSPNNRLVTGLTSPMGTVHGLSKYPYMREVRRIVGRTAPGYSAGFAIDEIDVTRNEFTDEYYRQLSPEMQRNLGIALGGLQTIPRIRSNEPFENLRLRTRSRLYPDSVGIGHYALDFHPCMKNSPHESPGNIEYPGVRQGGAAAYPYQIPLRAMIPQKLDNFLVVGKAIATSQVAASTYRVHSFEWSSGAAAGTLIDFALDRAIAPYTLVDQLPQPEPELEALQQQLIRDGNVIAFPDTSILNLNWDEWK
jgi:hypothetical protein